MTDTDTGDDPVDDDSGQRPREATHPPRIGPLVRIRQGTQGRLQTNQSVTRATGRKALAGWTTIIPSSDTKKVYVSSSLGHDTNYNGLAPEPQGGGFGPKATVAAGKALLTPGKPDWLLFRRGDTWSGGLGTWTLSGRNTNERMVVGAYDPQGTPANSIARPQFQTGNGEAGLTCNNAASYLAFLDLDFQCTHQPATNFEFGMQWFGTSQHVLIEGCRFDHYDKNLLLQGGDLRNFALRRNLFSYAYIDGFYVQYTTGLLIEECIFYANSIENTVQVVNRHHSYIDHEGCDDITFRDNLMDYAWMLGIQTRVGGLVTGNVVSRCGRGIQVGHGELVNGVVVPVASQVVFNAVVEGNPELGGAFPDAFLIDTMTTAAAEDNIFANTSDGGKPVQFWFDNTPLTPGTINYKRNIHYNWKSEAPEFEPTLRIYDEAAHYAAINIQECDFYSTLDTMPIFELNDNSTIDKVHTGAGNGCRFYSQLQASNNLFKYNNAGHTLAQFKSDQTPDDTKSTAPGSNFGYPTAALQKPDKATLGGYHAFLGGTATADAFMAVAVTNRKGRWDEDFTAKRALKFIRGCFGLT